MASRLAQIKLIFYHTLHFMLKFPLQAGLEHMRVKLAGFQVQLLQYLDTAADSTHPSRINLFLMENNFILY